MSTYVLMRILESAPRRYDFGIRLLTLGKLDRAYDRLASHIRQGQRVLDLGCGTGALTLRAAAKGADVKGIDVNPQMLEIAERRARDAGLAEKIQLREMGVAELGGEESESYDAVMSGLCLSELSQDEVVYTLNQVRRILKPGGVVFVADEVKPGGLTRRLFHSLIRFPLVVLAYIVTQQTTHSLEDLPARLREAGLLVRSARTNVMESFVELVAQKPGGAAR